MCNCDKGGDYPDQRNSRALSSVGMAKTSETRVGGCKIPDRFTYNSVTRPDVEQVTPVHVQVGLAFAQSLRACLFLALECLRAKSAFLSETTAGKHGTFGKDIYF